MTAQELERLILHKCHQHTHIHMHSPEFADMYMSRVIHMHLSSNPDLLCVHTVKGIHGAHKHFHRETWIFMKHTGYMQHPPAVLLSVFLRHSKIWPTLCVLAPLYQVIAEPWLLLLLEFPPCSKASWSDASACSTKAALLWPPWRYHF